MVIRHFINYLLFIYSNADSGTFYDIYARINNTNIEMISNSNWSDYKATVILYYTKTVDK